MKRIRNTIQQTVIFAALLLGCGEGRDSGTNGGSGTPLPGATTNGQTAPMSSDRSGTALGGTGGIDSATSSAGAGAGGGGAGSTADTTLVGVDAASCGTAPQAPSGPSQLSCSPPPAGACGQCQCEKCPELMQLCGLDPDCTCMATCVASSGLGAVDTCLDSCGVSGSPPGFANLVNCVGPACPDSDECSKPAGFAPPPDIVATGSSGGGIGSGDLPECSFDAGLYFDPLGEVLQLESADTQVCVRLERRNDGAGTMANTAYTLLDMRVGPLGEVVHIAEPHNICWHSSHHNFGDWAHAWSGARHYDVKVHQSDHGGPRSYALLSYEQGPLEASTCAPASEGFCPVGDAIELFPFNP
ncbi:MAG: hypothetical protein OEZ06_12140 [Myxococcales bacterium]|nr:hypothetical protein [Myxococcales bacterium]